MKLAIMQPYFFPYVGYFQLMNATEEFVIYDNIKFSKNGWINRNRILVNGKDSYITVPLKNNSDHLDIRERRLADIWPIERKKMLNRIKESYRKAPQFDIVYPLIEKCIVFEESNLFSFILHSLFVIKEHLKIRSSFVVSSSIPLDHKLRAEKKVLGICKARKAGVYINPIGGTKLYSQDNFNCLGIELYFLKTNDIRYEQFDNEFIPSLSIIDVLMFNTEEKIKEYLNSHYVLINGSGSSDS